MKIGSDASLLIQSPLEHRYKFSRLDNSVKVKAEKALYENSFFSYGASPAIRDHTVLPATRHKWTRPAGERDEVESRQRSQHQSCVVERQVAGSVTMLLLATDCYTS